MKVHFPSELPITERVEEIKDLLATNQVLIVAGETGSGKSTQLPKICLDMGLGANNKFIGHTQPRRLAARSVAERIAAETETEVGDVVGFKVRFTDEVSKRTRVKLMTDGILLAEIQRDRMLSTYDTIIIDEAHERSLNIDFLLGYLRELLPRRPDLKIIVTSATIDTARFSEHFGGAPIVEVSGRTYPVEVRYRPLEDSRTGEVRDQPTAIGDAVQELWRDQTGDILVFCSGERDIRDAHDALSELKLHNTEIFPLYARLSAAEQHRVFAQHKRRRIVLATNVAETSLTVPGIRTVIDPGNARISRYSLRTKVQRLPIEPISQASANQRAGRCGRLGPGVCIRLYSEDDYVSRPEFTEPEIQRTNLAAVILQMASLGLGNVSAFPFVEPPEERNIRDGIALLEELDAVDPEHVGTRRWLTPMGKKLAKLPVDPRLGRMIVEAGRNNCLHEVMVIVSAMSVIDPRERPADNRQAADESHARFRDPSSDFLSYLALWNYAKAERKTRSQNQFRKLCRQEFLNFNRIREWQDVYRQLRRVAKEIDVRSSSSDAVPDDIHYSLLSGLLSHIGLRDEKTVKAAKPKAGGKSQGRGQGRVEYVGARGAKFVIANGSALTKKPPIWVIAGELMETNRLWARTLSQIDPAWAEQLGEHLTKHSYGEPWWDAERGSALTTERVSLFGLPLVAGRRRNLEGFDAPLARELFIHHALIEGEWSTQEVGDVHEFVAHNTALKREIEALEARARQSDLMADRDRLFRFYDERLPQSATSSRQFNAWWKKERRTSPELLHLSRETLLAGDDSILTVEAFPDEFRVGDVRLPLAYEFDPASPIDGITIDIPVVLLNQVSTDDFSWLVPGFRLEAVELLMRAMPKVLRKTFAPIPETAHRVTQLLEAGPGARTLAEALRHELERSFGVHIPEDQLDVNALPRHLRPTYRIVGVDDETLAAGKDLDSLRLRVEAHIRRSLESTGHEIEQAGLTGWDFGELPAEVEARSGHNLVRAFPTLVDRGSAVDICLVATKEEQAEALWSGTRRLLRLAVPSPIRSLDRALSPRAQSALAANTLQTKSAWFLDAIDCAMDFVLSESGGVVYSQEGFERILSRAQDTVPGLLAELANSLGGVLEAIVAIEGSLGESVETSWSSLEDFGKSQDSTRSTGSDLNRADAVAHRDRLVYPGMLTGVGFQRLPDLVRYLRALAYRIEELPTNLGRDSDAMRQCRGVETLYATTAGGAEQSEASEQIAWMIEDFRAARFAPHLGSSGKIAGGKVSEKKIKLALARL